MLLADPRIQRPFFEPRVASATQVMAAIDPLVTIGVLLLCAALFRVRFAGAYLILALVVFSLTFAGGCGLGRTLAEQIRSNPLLGIRVAGFFDDRGPARTGDATAGSGAILGALDQLAAYVKSHRVDMIYITLPMASQPRIVRLLDELHDHTASIYYVPDLL